MLDFLFGNSFIVRTILAVIMLSSILKFCSVNKVWLVIISFVLTLGISFEILSVSKKKKADLPSHPALIATICLSIFFFNVLPALINLYPDRKTLSRLKYLKPLVFLFYTIGLTTSFAGLSRDILSSQILLLSVIHIASFVACLACALNIKNIIHGKILLCISCLIGHHK